MNASHMTTYDAINIVISVNCVYVICAIRSYQMISTHRFISVLSLHDTIGHSIRNDSRNEMHFMNGKCINISFLCFFLHFCLFIDIQVVRYGSEGGFCLCIVTMRAEITVKRNVGSCARILYNNVSQIQQPI